MVDDQYSMSIIPGIPLLIDLFVADAPKGPNYHLQTVLKALVTVGMNVCLQGIFEGCVTFSNQTQG